MDGRPRQGVKTKRPRSRGERGLLWRPPKRPASRARPGRRRGPQSPVRDIGVSAPNHKCGLGSPAMRRPQGSGSGQKKGSIRGWSLKDRTEVQIRSRADGRGRRIRHLPAGPSLGRRIRLKPVVADLTPREEETVQVTSTKRIWMSDRSPARWARECQPCAPCREGQPCCPEIATATPAKKNLAPLEGRAGPSCRRHAAYREEQTPTQGRRRRRSAPSTGDVWRGGDAIKPRLCMPAMRSAHIRRVSSPGARTGGSGGCRRPRRRRC
jgi:hypothetical protein